MGGGNGQKAKMGRERNLEKNKPSEGSQLETNKKAMSIQCIKIFILCLLSANMLLWCPKWEGEANDRMEVVLLIKESILTNVCARYDVLPTPEEQRTFPRNKCNHKFC